MLFSEESGNVDDDAPSVVSGLLREADARILEYLLRRRGAEKGCVSSDFALVNAALQRIVAKDLASGTLFCEWGSGFGVVTLLASLHGFDAHGIEIQPDLVEFAEQLAEEFACDVRFVQGTYVPPDGEKLAATPENPWFDSGTSSAYQELEIDADQFDVIFAYPWPGGESLLTALFMQCAGEGAILLTYDEANGVLVQRKTASLDVLELIDLRAN